MNEALRRMYIACKNRSGFPSTMSTEVEGEDGTISIHAILQGLGLTDRDSSVFDGSGIDSESPQRSDAMEPA